MNDFLRARIKKKLAPYLKAIADFNTGVKQFDEDELYNMQDTIDKIEAKRCERLNEIAQKIEKKGSKINWVEKQFH